MPLVPAAEGAFAARRAQQTPSPAMQGDFADLRLPSHGDAISFPRDFVEPDSACRRYAGCPGPAPRAAHHERRRPGALIAARSSTPPSHLGVADRFFFAFFGPPLGATSSAFTHAESGHVGRREPGRPPAAALPPPSRSLIEAAPTAAPDPDRAQAGRRLLPRNLLCSPRTQVTGRAAPERASFRSAPGGSPGRRHWRVCFAPSSVR
jgi:hypothetical protein